MYLCIYVHMLKDLKALEWTYFFGICQTANGLIDMYVFDHESQQTIHISFADILRPRANLCLPDIPAIYQYVPHKAVAEVAKIANYRRLVAVNHGPQSKSTNGTKSAWRQRSVGVVVVAIVVAML